MSLLDANPQKWPVDWRDRLNEREAIMIADAGMTPQAAYRAAVEDVRRVASKEPVNGLVEPNGRA